MHIFIKIAEITYNQSHIKIIIFKISSEGELLNKFKSRHHNNYKVIVKLHSHGNTQSEILFTFIIILTFNYIII